MSRSIFALLLLCLPVLCASEAAPVAAERQLVDLDCEPEERLVIDQDCIDETEVELQETLEKAADLLDRTLARKKAKQTRQILAADRRLANRTRPNRVERACAHVAAPDYRECARDYIQNERMAARDRIRAANGEFREARREANAEFRATRRTAVRVQKEAAEGCCECQPLESMRF